MQHVIERPDVGIIQREVHPLVERAEAVIVVSPETCESAIEFARNLKAAVERVKDFMGPSIAAAHKLHRTLTGQRNELLRPLEAAEREVRRKVNTWTTEQERRRREAEEAARHAALKAEEERRLREAEKLEAQGRRQAAEQVIAEPIAAPPVVLPTSVPAVEGVARRTVWKYRIVDAAQLPREYLIPDEKRIAGIVRAMKGETRIPGVEIWEETVMAIRST